MLKKAEGKVVFNFCLNWVTNFMVPMNFEMNPMRKSPRSWRISQ